MAGIATGAGGILLRQRFLDSVARQPNEWNTIFLSLTRLVGSDGVVALTLGGALVVFFALWGVISLALTIHRRVTGVCVQCGAAR